MQHVMIVRSSHLQGGHQALSYFNKLENKNFILIYFIFDGVNLANKHIELPTDEPNISQSWQELASKYDFNLKVCAASAARRGIVEDNLAERFSFGSIGELVEACEKADKVHCI